MCDHSDGPRRMTATSGAFVAGMQYKRGVGAGTTIQPYRRAGIRLGTGSARDQIADFGIE